MVNTLSKFNMQPKVMVSKRNLLFQCAMLRFHVKRRGNPLLRPYLSEGIWKTEIFNPMTYPWDEHRFFDRSHELLDFYGIN